jgi:hypothetical protein
LHFKVWTTCKTKKRKTKKERKKTKSEQLAIKDKWSDLVKNPNQ